MTSISLDLSGKVETRIVNVLETVSHVFVELNMPYVVVGAHARDLVLHYGYGAEIQRATDDVDFAIEVPDWNAFNHIKEVLNNKGFRTTKQLHRLKSDNNTMIDIIPFGGIEDEQSNIAWPPGNDVVMKMPGFKEACEHAQWVRVQKKPEVKIPVATPEGMSLLKLIAWLDRARDLRNKDAKDIAYILSIYEIIPEVKETLYNEKKIMERVSWDLTQAASYLLGLRARAIAKENTVKMLNALMDGELKHHSLELLVEEMCVHIDSNFERNNQLLTRYMGEFNA